MFRIKLGMKSSSSEFSIVVCNGFKNVMLKFVKMFTKIVYVTNCVFQYRYVGLY